MIFLRRLFEWVPSQVIFWALFAWMLWKLIFLCVILYVKDTYFYISVAGGVTFIAFLLLSKQERRYKLVVPALIIIELAIASTPKW